MPPASSAQILLDSIAGYAIYLLDPEGRVASWNPGAEHCLGYRAADILGRHFTCFYTAEDRAAGLPERALAVAGATGRFEDEGWRVRQDGSRVWASVLIEPARDAAGSLVGYTTVARDIGARRDALEALRASHEQFRILVEGVTDYAIYMLAPDGTIASWNAGAERIKGYRAAEVIGTHFSRFYPEPERERGLPAAALAAALRDGRHEAEGERVRRDGSRFRASVVIDAIRDPAGRLLGFAKVTRDITERLALEQARQALQHARKLEAIGKLTGGVAHDFNNLLQVISGSLQLIQLNPVLAGQDALQRHLAMALGAVERGAKLSSQLLAFARRQPLQPQVLEIGAVLRGMEDLLQRALNATIALATAVPPDLWHVTLDPHQLENVVLNLALNARDAMPQGGNLTIELANAVLDETYVSSLHDVPPGQYVLLAVTDTGTGMPPEVLERAVDPFFTTKPEGKGTGLGLSMAFGFVKQSGGHFRIYSEAGHGTTVKMYFPRSAGAPAPDAEPPAAPARGGSETVLVVEDDPQVRASVVAMLRDLGYEVRTAESADAALALLESGLRCDLLFTDVILPGTLNSLELARMATALQPGLRVLYTSGYPENAIIHSGRLEPGMQLLTKPYRREQLAGKIRQLLSTRNVTYR
ncbi:MAG TPA: PAS domain S-box protein [Telluria sp.]|nr:PAS domain S-box protein [Telluria sp.]